MMVMVERLKGMRLEKREEIIKDVEEIEDKVIEGMKDMEVEDHKAEETRVIEEMKAMEEEDHRVEEEIKEVREIEDHKEAIEGMMKESGKIMIDLLEIRRIEIGDRDKDKDIEIKEMKEKRGASEEDQEEEQDWDLDSGEEAEEEAEEEDIKRGMEEVIFVETYFYKFDM